MAVCPHTRHRMLTHLESTGAGFEPKLEIAPRSAMGKNWFTVFIAENGGRKSFLLRCLVETALGRSRYAPERGSSIGLYPPEELPERVIAISGTPLDRFPRVGTRDLKSKRRRRQDDFVYLGPRASNGMAGVAQSERSFIGSLISNRHRLAERATLLKRAFSLLDLAPHVDVTLAVDAGRELDLSSQERDALYELHRSMEVQGGSESSELLEAVSGIEDNPSRVFKALDQMKAKGIRLRIGADGARHSTRNGLSLGMWELLLRLGRVSVAGTQFHTSKSLQPISGEQLSSGQWGWLGTFGSLVAEIRHNSLILVDEPENSLHPRWQQEFIRELHTIVSGFKDCQVVVATHSPLIASGVSQEWGSIRTLTRPRRVGAFVRSQELPTAFGWNASDVYAGPFGLQSTRAPDFLESANKALKKLSAGAAISSKERDQWIAQFTENCQALPPFDSMRDVLENVVRRLEASEPASADDKKASK